MEDKIAKVLIVDDDENISEVIKMYLENSGYDTKVSHNGKEAQEFFIQYKPDIVLLDIMLPSVDGIDVLKWIRKQSEIPVIMLTAKGETFDKVLGLELGADDYICKPFSPREVVARVKTVLRRSGGVTSQTNGLILDESRFRATLHGKELDLTSVEFTLLNLLASNPGRIYRRQQLMDHIYPDQRIVCDRTIDSHIKKLRKKIATAANPGEEFIQSLYGAGYKFE